jgi:hypothetical protein
MTLRELCKEACGKHKTAQEAIAWAMKQVNRDRDLLDELLMPIITSAINMTVYQIRHEDKRDLKYPKDTRRGLDSIALASATIAAGLLASWLMPDGTALADATCEMLTLAARDCRAEAAGNLINADFYAALAKKVTGGKTVADCIDDTEAERLLERVKKVHGIAA